MAEMGEKFRRRGGKNLPSSLWIRSRKLWTLRAKRGTTILWLWIIW
jgi:hypothetical protein